MSFFTYTVCSFDSTVEKPKVIATIDSRNERSAWVGVVNYAKAQQKPVRVFANEQYRGIVHPDGRTESCFGGI